MTIVCRRGDCAFCADAYTANDTSSTIANRTNPPFACRRRTFSLFTIHSFHVPGTPAPSTGDDEGERQKRRGIEREAAFTCLHGRCAIVTAVSWRNLVKLWERRLYGCGGSFLFNSRRTLVRRSPRAKGGGSGMRPFACRPPTDISVRHPRNGV